MVEKYFNKKALQTCPDEICVKDVILSSSNLIIKVNGVNKSKWNWIKKSNSNYSVGTKIYFYKLMIIKFKFFFNLFIKKVILIFLLII